MTPGRLCGVVLAGGKSSRFGSDKASAIVGGRPMLDWVASALGEVCDDIVVVAAEGQRLPAIAAPIRRVNDLFEHKGPLAGLVSAFRNVTAELCFATSCDAPLVAPQLVRGLASLAEGHDIVVPLVDGFLQPLMAIYRPAECASVFEERVLAGQLKITAAYGPLRTRVVRADELREFDPDLGSFLNVNRAEQIAEIEARLRGK